MELASRVSIEHLIYLHNIGIRLIALEMVPSAIEAKDNPAWAGRRTGRRFCLVSCVWHNGQVWVSIIGDRVVNEKKTSLLQESTGEGEAISSSSIYEKPDQDLSGHA